MPASPDELKYHQMLLAGGPEAATIPDILWRLYYIPLTNFISHHHPDADVDDVSDMVSDAIFAYVRQPEKYKPEGKSLSNYLQMVADSDLRNKLATIRNRARRQITYGPDVGFEDIVRNIPIHDDPGDRVTAEELRAAAHTVARNPTELAIVDLLLEDVRNYAPYAEALNLQHLDEATQRTEVNRVKELMRGRLRRKLGPDWRPR